MSKSTTSKYSNRHITTDSLMYCSVFSLESPFHSLCPARSKIMYPNAPLQSRADRRALDGDSWGVGEAAIVYGAPPPKPKTPPTAKPDPDPAPEAVEKPPEVDLKTEPNETGAEADKGESASSATA